MEVKTVQDYYQQLFDLYPDVPQSDIKKIMLFGLKSFSQHNNYGGDVLIHNHNLWMYTGKLMKNSIRYYNYYKRKMIIKLRILHKRLEIPWDGYYYFALYKNGYDHYLSQKNKRGRPKKHFSFGNIVFYKYYDECVLRHTNSLAIFKISFGADFGLTMYKSDFKTDKAELVLEKQPLKFKEILASNYRYEHVTKYTKWKKKKDNG